jgi:hypothetical protein
MSSQTAFGGMLQQLVELTSLVLRPEPLDAEIERRCKQAWEEAPCPEGGETAIQAGDGSDILMAYSYHSANRTIHMTDHQDPPVDTWMGRSNGQWEGDTLVIETYGFNGRAWLDRAGNFLSPAAVVTERLTLIADDIMEYEATIRDRRTFSEPWTIRMPLYRRVEPNAQLLEYKCVPFVEELLYKDLQLPEDE